MCRTVVQITNEISEESLQNPTPSTSDEMPNTDRLITQIGKKNEMELGQLTAEEALHQM